jgi:drug/metabolite transporter (DMT)-like permease
MTTTVTGVQPRNRALGLFLAALTSVLWGTVPLAGKIALAGISPAALSSLRLLSAGVFVAIVLSRRRGGLGTLLSRPPPLIYLATLALACNYLCYMLGLERAGAGTTQVLIQLAPLFLILLGIVWLKERPNRRQMAGAAVALAGVFLVSQDPERADATLLPGRSAGITLILVAGLAWGVYAAAHRRLGERLASGPTTAWIFLFSALLIAPAIPLGPARAPDLVQVIAIVYLCLNTAAAYWAFAESLRHIEATVVAVIVTLGPVVTLALLALSNTLGWERVGPESLTPWKLGGAALVVSGVILAVATRDRASAAPAA